MSSKASASNVNDQTTVEESDKPLWRHVTKQEKIDGGGNISFQCSYCNCVFKGSYSRVKAHLLKIKGYGIRGCPKVSDQSIQAMKKEVEEADLRIKNSMPKSVSFPKSSASSHNSGVRSELFPQTGGEARKRKAPENTALEKSFNLQALEQLDYMIARMFYTYGLPFNLARNHYFMSSYSYASNNSISGYKPPGYNKLITTLLQNERANVERLLTLIKSTWSEKGLSLVTDRWTDPQRRPIINFMAVIENGPMFLKGVNCEGEYKDKYFIADLLKDAIQEVGPSNVVQVITDNAPICKSAGLLIEAQYPHVFWTPCMVRTLNLALKNICSAKNTEDNAVVYDECHWITDIVGDVMFVKNFVRGHSMRLAIFNEFVSLKMFAIAPTRFAYAIVMLRRFKLVKAGLQSMVICEKWSSYREDDVGKAKTVKEKILDDLWWDNIDYILSFTEPIYEMLRVAATDAPCLHLVYDMWDSMIEKVKATIYRHKRKKEDEESTFYCVVHSILVSHWTKSTTPLHCLAHSLNPRYYSSEWLNEDLKHLPPHKDLEIVGERNKCLKRYYSNPEERRMVNVEYARFSGVMDAFQDHDSISDRSKMDAKSWW